MLNLFCSGKRLITRFLFLLFLFFCGIGWVSAETIKVVDCEYTEQYKDWLKLSDSEKKKVTMPVKCKTNDKFFAAVGSSVRETYQSSKFDLRDYGYVTSIKDQGKGGLCWAFSTYASMESNLLMNGKGTYDFSEAHMGFSAQNKSFDSLMPVNRTYDDAGNYFISSAYLFNRMGPVIETDMQYSYLLASLNGGALPTVSDLSSKKSVFSVDSTAVLSSDQGVCSNDAITSIKKYLVSNGAIAGNIFYDSGKLESVTSNFEIVSNTLNGEYYYYDGSSYTSDFIGSVSSNSAGNHAVTIVGWDDTISASNFSTTPSRDGAWIVKNSYGITADIGLGGPTPMGDQGYYYVSYDDINICTSLTGFYDISSEKEDNAYYHDTIGVNYAIQYMADLYVANVFEKKYNGAEKLKQVSFFSYEVNQKYDVLVSLDGNLSNAIVVKSGVTDRVGYISVDIDGIDLSNPKYGVAIKHYYDANKDNLIASYFKSSFNFYNSMDVNLGLSFVSVDGKQWADFVLSGTNCLASVRAYTNNLDYTFKENSNSVKDNKFVVLYDYDNVTNFEHVKYNIYLESDTSYKNSLNNNFEIINNLENDKNISIGINDKSSEGNYIFVAQYKDVKVITKFIVSTDDNGELFFGKKEVSKEEEDNNSGDIEIEIEDNPLNNNTDNNTGSSGKKEEEITNPKTGSLNNIALIIIIAVSFGISLGINIYIENKRNV